MRKLDVGSEVRVREHSTVPARYRGRYGRVVSKAKVGYFVKFPQRKAPLMVRREILVA